MRYKQIIRESKKKSLPGAPSGVQIMTPQQFVANQSEEESDVAKDKDKIDEMNPMLVRDGLQVVIDFLSQYPQATALTAGAAGTAIVAKLVKNAWRNHKELEQIKQDVRDWSIQKLHSNKNVSAKGGKVAKIIQTEIERRKQGVAEATKLAAPSRPIGDKELTDYLDRIRGVPDIDKKTGLPKVDKKGKEKYVSGKTKQDKFRMPYIHRNSVMRYYSPAGKVYNTDAMKDEMKQRPPKLLKQNEKMKHSNGELEQFFNIGFAALVGAAIDESTNEVIIVNTCPGAGACMVDCFEMKGGFIQYEAGWLSRSRILTYLLNDPQGFSNQLNAEIDKEARAGAKGGYSVSVRWHNSGDFFSPEYIQLAFNIAKANPTVKFYAYTKIAEAALADKPKNFIINWSEGAKIGQEKKIKAQDPNLERTKNSRIVPENLFWDLLKKDAKGNLDKEGADDKGAGGRWVMRDQAATAELKKRLSQKYGLSVSSILDYDEYMAKRNSIPTGMKYNVIVAPGEGDVSANDHGVLSTLLLRH
jgi:hypothetical protein